MIFFLRCVLKLILYWFWMVEHAFITIRVGCHHHSELAVGQRTGHRITPLFALNLRFHCIKLSFCAEILVPLIHAWPKITISVASWQAQGNVFPELFIFVEVCVLEKW